MRRDVKACSTKIVTAATIAIIDMRSKTWKALTDQALERAGLVMSRSIHVPLRHPPFRMPILQPVIPKISPVIFSPVSIEEEDRTANHGISESPVKALPECQRLRGLYGGLLASVLGK